MTERHGGGHAGLAGKNLAAVLGVQQAEIEEVAGQAGLFHLFAGKRRQPKGLRHFARARLIVPGRARHQQHAPGTCRVLLLAFGLLNPIARFEPLDRQLEVGIGEPGAGLPRARALVVLVVCLPGDLDDLGNLTIDVLEERDRRNVGAAGARTPRASAARCPGLFAPVLPCLLPLVTREARAYHAAGVLKHCRQRRRREPQHRVVP